MAAVPLDVFAAEFGPLAPERALGILRGIAEQLDRLAEFGGFHGALTPAAILVTEAGEVQLLPPQPLPEVVAESYTAPELRRRGTAVDGRADQYGLALIAWELLAAQPRVTRDEATGVAVIHQVNVTPGHVLRPGLSRHIGAVLHDALNRDPAGRYPSAGAFVDALAIAIDDRPAPSSFRPPDAPDGPRQVTNRRREKRSYDPTSGSRLVTATGLAAAVAAVAAITWLVGGGGGGPAPRWLNQWFPRASGFDPIAAARSRTTREPTVQGSTSAGTPSAGTGFVRVRITDGAPEVLVDGDVVGRGPRVVAVSAGPHRISVREAGRTYLPPVAAVVVSASDTSDVTFAAP